MMPDWFAGDVLASGVKTHYWRTGGEKRPLV
ncbi:MAG: alpha/beta hydrolase, partial [Anaerolineales bacterium]